MKMYVFEEVLWDYTAGMAMVLANTLEEAQNARVAHYVYGGG